MVNYSSLKRSRFNLSRREEALKSPGVWIGGRVTLFMCGIIPIDTDLEFLIHHSELVSNSIVAEKIKKAINDELDCVVIGVHIQGEVKKPEAVLQPNIAFYELKDIDNEPSRLYS